MTPPLDPALLDRLPPEVRAVLEAQAFALSAERAHRQHLESEHAALQACAARTAAEKAVMAAENTRMKELLEDLAPLLRQLRLARFAPSSEKLDPDQLQLCFEDLEQAVAAVKEKHREKDAPGAEAEEAPATGKRRGRPTKEEAPVRRSLPKDLPRIEKRIEPDSLICPCGCGQMVQIGEDRSERLDIVPAQLRVIETVRPRYACPKGRAGIVQAPPPAWLIEGGLPTEAFIAWLLVSKYADALPLYRLSQILARSGVVIDRSTLADWVGRAAFHLDAIVRRMMEHLKRSTKLFMDETTAPVLDPGRGRTKTGFIWALTRDDRRWSGPGPAITVFTYAPGRGGTHAEEILKGFDGVLQVDGYAGYNRLTKAARTGGKPITLAYCWAHARRELIKATPKTGSPIAAEALARIARLYAIEKEIHGRSAEERLALRRERSAPLVADLSAWVREQAARLSPKSRMGKALRYVLKHWDGLVRFLDDGRIEMDSNPVENSIRPIALQRKNSLFAGHDEGGRHWACAASVIATCKLNGVEPFAWMKATLEAIAKGHPQSRIDELMPWNFRPLAAG
ncbi:IS66 family transposase [Salipiger abyssi]|uniref:IS66 family transposase n=1 Tax=Salipiger abyssi TaxID=1250539 RepID=UPI001A8D5E3D|nr:IS66 family transposase [Salipiger abyssi]MBN9890154.1 IS66 family transposase [Salipiger abyssi]